MQLPTGTVFIASLLVPLGFCPDTERHLILRSEYFMTTPFYTIVPCQMGNNAKHNYHINGLIDNLCHVLRGELVQLSDLLNISNCSDEMRPNC